MFQKSSLNNELFPVEKNKENTQNAHGCITAKYTSELPLLSMEFQGTTLLLERKHVVVTEMPEGN